MFENYYHYEMQIMDFKNVGMYFKVSKFNDGLLIIIMVNDHIF